MREMEYPAYPSVAGPRLRWSSILAGSAMTVAVLASLNVLGIGLGYSPPAAAGAIPSTVTAGAVGGGAWWTLGAGLVAFYLGGWFSSRLSDSGRRCDGAIYGLVSWAVAALAPVFWPSAAFGGALTAAAPGVFVFMTLAAHAAAAGFGGVAGARLYLPVPVGDYRKRHREFAGTPAV